MKLNQEHKKQLIEKGYCVIKNFFNEEEVAFLKDLLKTNHTHKNSNNILKEIKPLANFPDYWDLISNKKILSFLRFFLNEDVCYLHNSHSVYQEDNLDIDTNWHRDNACRVYGVGPDWDTNLPYDVVRVGIYLPDHKSNTGLSVIPKTHNSKKFICKLLRYLRSNQKRIYHSRLFKSIFNFFFGKKIFVNEGDCIFFLANLFHAALPSRGLRKAIFLSYGRNNKHSLNYLNYYLKHRVDSSNFIPDPKKIDLQKFNQHLIKNNIFIDTPKEKIDIHGLKIKNFKNLVN